MKTKIQFHLILCLVLGVFLAFPSNAWAGFPRIQSALKQLENALAEASPTAPPDSKAKLSTSLNTALKLLQSSYDAQSGHHALAIQDVQFAIGEADKGDLQHLAKDYITQAITETKAALAEYSSTPSTTTFVVTAPAAEPSRNAPTIKLSAAQTQAVVLIKGDHGEGTGFLVKTADGPTVITNIHVLSNNPNLKIFTNSGQQITTVSLKGAVDRDLAMFAIKDQNYSYLELATDVGATVQTGDQVVTPGNSQGGEVMLNTGGKILGIGPDRIEISNPVFHGNSGGPIFHTKSGQVVGVVSMGMPVMITDDLDKISFESGSSAIARSMRYFGLRVDNVPKWEPYDWNQLQNETLFLDQFQRRSVCLVAYLNSRRNPGIPSSGIYLTDDKLKKAIEDLQQQTSGGADATTRKNAYQEFLDDLNGLADSDMDAIQQANNFYSFDQQRAKEELSYRQAIKKELDFIGNDLGKLGYKLNVGDQ